MRQTGQVTPRPARPGRRSARRSGDAGPGATGAGVSAAQHRFAERARRVRRRRWIVVVGCLLVAALVAGGAWGLTASPWLRLQEVAVAGAQPDRESGIRDQLRTLEGIPLIEVDLDAAAAEIDSTLLYSDVEVTRAWPDTLRVRVEERVPAAVAGLGDGAFALIDREGVAYERVPSPPPGMPVASLTHVDDQDSRATAAAIGLALTPATAARVERLTVDERGSATFMISGVSVLWGDASDSDIKAAVLTPLLDSGRVSRIDVTAPMNPVTTR